MTFQFDDYEVDQVNGTLTLRGRGVPIQEQPFQLLLLLLAHAGSVVTRESIRLHLWPDNTNVEYDKSLRVAVSKLREALRDDSAAPIFIETLPRRGYRFIAPVTVLVAVEVPLMPEPKPTERLAAPIIEGRPPAFESRVPTAYAEEPRPAADPARWHRLRVMSTAAKAALSALGIGIVLVFASRKWRQVAPHPVTAQSSVRRSVAVIGPYNLTGSQQDRWLSTALAEMLSAELSATGKVRTISAEELAQAGLSELPGSSPSHQSIVGYARRLGADIVVFGSYAVVRSAAGGGSPQLRLDLRMDDVSYDAPEMTLVRTGLTTNLFSLVSESGAELRQRIGIAATEESAAAVRRTLPSDPIAAQLYAEGLSHWRESDPVGARDLLEKAAAIEPGHAGTHHALANVWHNMGYEQKARTEAALAVTLSAGLPREEVLEMEGELATLSRNWPKAVEIFRTLLTFYPDSVDDCISLARAQYSGTDGNGALATLATLRRTGLPLADQGRLDLIEANTELQMSKFNEAITVSDRAIAIGTQLDQKYFRARGLWMKASGLERIGKFKESLDASAEAQSLFREMGDKRGLAVALLMSGDVLYDHGRTTDARTLFVESTELARATGNRGQTGNALERVGNTYMSEGALVESRREYEQALQLYREIDSNAFIASAIGNIANVEEVEGDLAEASKSNAEALRLFTKLGDKRGIATTLNNTGFLELERGDILAASSDLNHAVRVSSEISLVVVLANALLGQGDVMVVQNDVLAALRQYDKVAQTIQGKEMSDIHTSLLIARGHAIRLAGNPDHGMIDLQQAVDESTKNRDHAGAAKALAELSCVQIQLGHLADAQSSANRSKLEADAQPSPLPRLLAVAAIAESSMAQKDAHHAQDLLRPAIASAQQKGYLLLALRLRILESQSLVSKDARNEALHTLIHEAKVRGWMQLAAEEHHLSQLR